MDLGSNCLPLRVVGDALSITTGGNGGLSSRRSSEIGTERVHGQLGVAGLVNEYGGEQRCPSNSCFKLELEWKTVQLPALLHKSWCLKTCFNVRPHDMILYISDSRLRACTHVCECVCVCDMIRLPNWVKMWKMTYMHFSFCSSNGWKIPPTRASPSPHPFAKTVVIISFVLKEQIWHLRFMSSFHLASLDERGHGLSWVIIYCVVAPL